MKRKHGRIAATLALAVALALAVPMITAAADRQVGGTTQGMQAAPRALSAPGPTGVNLKDQSPSGVNSRPSAHPSLPSIPMGCEARKISSGWFATNHGIYAKNTSGKPIPATMKIKWTVYTVSGGYNKTSEESVATGEFHHRLPLKVGAEVKVTEALSGSTPQETFIIKGCEAVAVP